MCIYIYIQIAVWVVRRESTLRRDNIHSAARHNHLTNVMNDKYNFLPPKIVYFILRCVCFAFGYKSSILPLLYRKNPSHVYTLSWWCGAKSIYAMYGTYRIRATAGCVFSYILLVGMVGPLFHICESGN